MAFAADARPEIGDERQLLEAEEAFIAFESR
jgi:hypothetical protein